MIPTVLNFDPTEKQMMFQISQQMQQTIYKEDMNGRKGSLLDNLNLLGREMGDPFTLQCTA